MARVCFDVLLVKLFSPLSTRNDIIHRRKKPKTKTPTTKQRESAGRLGLTPFYGGTKLRNTVKACFLSSVRSFCQAAYQLWLCGSQAQPAHISTHAGLAAPHQEPLLHQVPEPSFVALAQALWAELCCTVGHKYVFMWWSKVMQADFPDSLFWVFN